MSIDDIPKFEKLNDIPVSVYTIQEEGKEVYPLYYTNRRDKDPISLLLIEGEEQYHYCWIKHFNKMLCYDSTHPKVFCPYCCYGFQKNRNGEEHLIKHKQVCEEYGPQRTELPKEGENIIKFEEIKILRRLPFCIYADFEAINKKMDVSEPDPDKAYTEKKNEHQISGFTLYSVTLLFINY